jgi:uncharacterized protein YjeT (DUF2065 family)
MQEFLTALALTLVIEGVLCALFPVAMRRAMAAMMTQPDAILRAAGLGAACLGVVGVWLIRH